MKEYVCTVCGYVHKGELATDFRCPVCGAGAEAFREVVKAEAVKPTRVVKSPQGKPKASFRQSKRA